MINLFDLLKTLQATVNPHQAGHIRPQQNFERWCNEIQQQIFEELARDMFRNRTISDKLTPFLKSYNVTLVSQPGKNYDTFVRPADYRYFSSARYIRSGNTDGMGAPCQGKGMIEGKNGQVLYEDPDERVATAESEGSHGQDVTIPYIDNQKWGAIFNHRTKGPSFSRPYITAYDTECRVAPRGIGVLVLDYLRPPKDCKFAYTVGSDDQIIFDPNNSINLEWDTNVMPDFIARLQSKYGVYVKEDFTYQAGQLQRTQVKS